MQKTTDEDMIGKEVKVCHMKFTITGCNPQSYTAEGEIGGVHQEVVLSDTYVRVNGVPPA